MLQECLEKLWCHDVFQGRISADILQTLRFQNVFASVSRVLENNAVTKIGKEESVRMSWNDLCLSRLFQDFWERRLFQDYFEKPWCQDCFTISGKPLCFRTAWISLSLPTAISLSLPTAHPREADQNSNSADKLNIMMWREHHKHHEARCCRTKVPVSPHPCRSLPRPCIQDCFEKQWCHVVSEGRISAEILQTLLFHNVFASVSRVLENDGVRKIGKEEFSADVLE